MPTTSVENTRGAIIILIRRRNSVVRIEKYPAIRVSCSADAALPSSIAMCSPQPTTSPRTSAPKIQ
jgi:hypothetical protein